MMRQIDNGTSHDAATLVAGTRQWWRWFLVERMRAALDSIDAARTSDQIRRLRSAIESELVGDHGRALRRQLTAAVRRLAARKHWPVYVGLGVAALGLGLAAVSKDPTAPVPLDPPAFPSLVLDGGLDSVRVASAAEPAGPAGTASGRPPRPEYLVTSAREILDAVGLADVRVNGGDAGTVRVSGYAQTGARWTRARETLLADIPGLERVDEASLETAGTRASALTTELAGLALGELAVRVNDDRVVVDGSLEHARLATWTALARQFRERYPDGPTLDDRVRRIVPPVDMNIRGALIQRRQQLLLLEVDGLYQRFRVGDVLPDGSTLTTVDKDFAVLTTTSGRRMIYDLRSNLWRSM